MMNTKLIVFVALGSGLLSALIALTISNSFSVYDSPSALRGDVLQEVLGFSQKEMVLFYSGLLELKDQKYREAETCQTQVSCAQRAFTRLMSRFHSSKILPMAKRWWANGSFERTWIERFLSENGLPLVKKGSRCLEWGTYYTEKIYGDVCTGKDSLEHSDKPQPATNSSIGLVFHDQIYTASTIPDNTYDVVICTQVHEHLYDPLLATKTMARILKPGGILIATGPHLCPFHKAPDDFFRYTHHGIASLFKRSGLTPIFEKQFGNVMMLVNVFEGTPVKELTEEEIFSKDEEGFAKGEAYTLWTIIGRKE